MNSLGILAKGQQNTVTICPLETLIKEGNEMTVTPHCEHSQYPAHPK